MAGDSAHPFPAAALGRPVVSGSAPSRTTALVALVALTALGALVRAGAPALARQAGGGVTLQTRIVLSGEGMRDAAPTDVVVAWEPEAATAAPRPGSFELATRNKEFAPPWLAVPAGSTVRFPNHDPILHNVFSVSPGNAFDVGLYGRGEGEKAILKSPGVVRVFCNVHRQMYAHVLVLATPYFGRPDAGGRIRLEGLPPGPGRLLLWHERTELDTRALSSPSAAPATIEVGLTRRRVPPHFNKFGRPYDRRDRYGD
jgi:plastocyanin